MVAPERRTAADLTAAAAIAVTVALAAALIWWTSDARATVSRPAAEPAPNPAAAALVPAALSQRWSAASPATPTPVVVSGVVVTGAGHQLTGRSPADGTPIWSYARGVDLCGVSWIYRYAVAVYPDDRGCGQVSTVDIATGRRGPARTSYADRTVTVSSDGSGVLALGPTRLELWRSDMVRVLSYGEIDARVKPAARGPGHGCRLLSGAAATTTVSVLESCPGQSGVQLTLLRAGKEEDEPEVQYVPQPGLSPDADARVLAVADSTGGTFTAVYLPTPQPRIEVIDQTGSTVAKTLLGAPATPASAGLTISRPSGLVSWWTGTAVQVFDADTLAHRFTIDGVGAETPLGPAAMMAGRLLVPVTGGIGVYDAGTGRFQRLIPLQRPADTTTVFPAVSGGTVLEQRGDTVVGLS